MKNIVYCFWTDVNEMSKTRRECLEQMQKVKDLEICLITPHNLDSYILKENPLHKGFYYLNPTHKSDYLRCYFMNFYGCGYSDIKIMNENYSKGFKILYKSDDYALGYKEVGKGGIAYVKEPLYTELCDNWEKIIGCGSFICKPNTPFTNQWYNELINKMDEKLAILKTKGDCLEWTEIMGNIFHPIVYKYHQKIIKDDTIKPDFSKPYR